MAIISTSPTPYMVLGNMDGGDRCGQVGTRMHTNITIAINPNDNTTLLDIASLGADAVMYPGRFNSRT